ncbi:MAG: hypothetical protein GY820_38585 [Gammaproteobacteria bacterium]|nr:hypothetical protein [Gammaproteobacteria bacterium]
MKSSDHIKNNELPTSEQMDKENILHRLRYHNWNMAQTANTLDIGRTTLYRKIHKYNIKVERNQENA